MIGPAPRDPAGSSIPPGDPIVAPRASSSVDLAPISGERRTTGHRLWKCRRYGNHRTVSTAPWKSRTEREIPTFPQPLPVGHEDDEEEHDERDAASHDVSTRQSTRG